MSSKQFVREILDQMPEESSLEDIAERIEFLAAVQEGIDSLREHGSIPIEEVEKEVPTWFTK